MSTYSAVAADLRKAGASASGDDRRQLRMLEIKHARGGGRALADAVLAGGWNSTVEASAAGILDQHLPGWRARAAQDDADGW